MVQEIENILLWLLGYVRLYLLYSEAFKLNKIQQPLERKYNTYLLLTKSEHNKFVIQIVFLTSDKETWLRCKEHSQQWYEVTYLRWLITLHSRH